MDQIDENTLDGFRNGKPESVAVIIHRYYVPLLNFLIRLGCPRSDAEDLVQESIIKAGKGLKRSYRHRNSFRSWLFCIARNTYKDFMKKASFRREFPVDIDVMKELDHSSEADPVETVLQRDRAEKVRRMIQSLPEAQRICIILQYYQGFSIKEIAAVIECPVGTVTSRIHNGLKRLRKIMSEEMNK